MKTMYISNLIHPLLTIKELTVNPGESWCIYGNNDSGIDPFLQFLQKKLTDYSITSFELPPSSGIISFRAQQELFEKELLNDDSDFMGRSDPGTLVKDFLPDYQQHHDLLHSFGMDQCLELGYRQLSSGQCRKLLILQELTSNKQLIILQNPYDGLDEKSCRELDQTLPLLADHQISIIIFVTIKSDIPNWCSNLAVVDDGRLRVIEDKAAFLSANNSEKTLSPDLLPHHTIIKEVADTVHNRPNTLITKNELIYLEDGIGAYGDNLLFTGLQLSISTGDHTLIAGRNGCGKSTLLDIITGDNQNCYANTLRIFGRQRGTGESIWDLKKQMGIISPALHRNHRGVGTALHVVLSGLFDSIGLYQRVHNQQINSARKWLQWVNLASKEKSPFSYLSFAEQRLVLIARALVKQPKLLILDEPTQGLDDHNRERLLHFLELVAEKQLSTIIFVSHRTDEHRGFFKKQIQLDSYKP